MMIKKLLNNNKEKFSLIDDVNDLLTAERLSYGSDNETELLEHFKKQDLRIIELKRNINNLIDIYDARIKLHEIDKQKYRKYRWIEQFLSYIKMWKFKVFSHLFKN